MDHFETSNKVGRYSSDDEEQSSGAPFDSDHATVSARSILKRNTDQIHQQLHDLPIFMDLMEGRLSLQRYRQLMNGFLNFYEEFDRAAAGANHRFSQHFKDHIYQPRAPIIRADVAALGGKPKTSCTVKKGDLNFDSLPEYVGALYVVDGSVLGGVTINKALKRNSNLVGKGGKSYWNWCKQNGLTHWQATLKLLEKTWRTDANPIVVTNAALRTFSILHGCLSEVERSLCEASTHE